jgi:hypothetical protein
MGSCEIQESSVANLLCEFGEVWPDRLAGGRLKVIYADWLSIRDVYVYGCLIMRTHMRPK